MLLASCTFPKYRNERSVRNSDILGAYGQAIIRLAQEKAFRDLFSLKTEKQITSRQIKSTSTNRFFIIIAKLCKIMPSQGEQL